MQQSYEGLTLQEKKIFSCIAVLLFVLGAFSFVAIFSSTDRNGNSILLKEQSSDYDTSDVVAANFIEVSPVVTTNTTNEFVVKFSTPEEISVSLEEGASVVLDPKHKEEDGSYTTSSIRVLYESEENVYTMVSYTDNRFVAEEGNYRIRYTSHGESKVINLHVTFKRETEVIMLENKEEEPEEQPLTENKPLIHYLQLDEKDSITKNNNLISYVDYEEQKVDASSGSNINVDKKSELDKSTALSFVQVQHIIIDNYLTKYKMMQTFP